MDSIEIARVAHEVNKAYCESLGDTSQPSWGEAPDWQRNSAISGVNFHKANPDAGPEHSHECWLKEKEAAGWKYGPVKDSEKKEHPCFVPYVELPADQKAKDYIFRAVVHALAGPAECEKAPGWRDLVSSNLNRARYILAEKYLEIEFKNGVRFGYQDVPVAVFDELCEADSPGKFFSSKISGIYQSAKID